MIRCVIYTRVSTEEQANKQISSLDAQDDLLHNYIEQRKGHKLTAIYREEGISGTSMKNRIELQKLLMDGQLRKFDLVLVTDLDRIGRNLKDFVNIWDTFKQNDIRFIAINQNIDTSTITGEALIQQLMIFAELESKMNKQRAEQKRRFEVVKKGKWYGGTVPFGYDHKAGKLFPDLREKIVLQQIFDAYLKFQSLYKTRDLINQSSTTKAGHPFSAEAVRLILRNQLYVGKVKYKEGYHPGTHEPLISESLFQAVQGILDKNQRIRKSVNGKYVFLLRNLLKCGQCNTAMIGTPQKSGRFLYYRCNSDAKFGNDYCDTKFIPAGDIEGAVEWGLKEISRQEIVFNRAIDTANGTAQAEIKKMVSDHAGKERAFRKTDSAISRVMDALKNGKKTIDLIEDELEGLEVKRNDLGREIDMLAIDIEKKRKYVIDRELMRKVLAEFGQLYDSLDTDRRINLIRLLVKEIEYFKGQVKIRLRDLTESGEKMSLILNEPLKFVQYQLLLPVLDTHRTTINLDIGWQWHFVKYRAGKQGRRIDQASFVFV